MSIHQKITTSNEKGKPQHNLSLICNLPLFGDLPGPRPHLQWFEGHLCPRSCSSFAGARWGNTTVWHVQIYRYIVLGSTWRLPAVWHGEGDSHVKCAYIHTYNICTLNDILYIYISLSLSLSLFNCRSSVPSHMHDFPSVQNLCHAGQLSGSAQHHGEEQHSDCKERDPQPVLIRAD